MRLDTAEEIWGSNRTLRGSQNARFPQKNSGQDSNEARESHRCYPFLNILAETPESRLNFCQAKASQPRITFNMATNKSQSVLEALENICNVDVDAINPRVSTAMPFKPHNRALAPLAMVE